MVFASPTIVPVNACETATGRYVDAVNPDPKDISITDISWSLARQARFAGHTLSDEIWSVGQHSIFVQELVDMAFYGVPNLQQSLSKWLQSKFHDITMDEVLDRLDSVNGDSAVSKAALLHDASEAYLVDLPSPVKRHALLREPYKALETNMMNVIYQAFSMPQLTPFEAEIVTWGDLLALRIEAAVLMPSRGRGWNGTYPEMQVADIQLFPRKVTPWKETHANFLKEFNELLH